MKKIYMKPSTFTLTIKNESLLTPSVTNEEASKNAESLSRRGGSFWDEEE